MAGQLPDKWSWDGQDSPDEPRWVSNDETLKILPQSAGDIHVIIILIMNKSNGYIVWL